MAKTKRTAIKAAVIPEAGARVGSVCGPCQNPKDAAGTVMCQITDRWGTYALVMLDTGKIAKCHVINSGPGIGWHFV
jgi:hypothetical protein